MVLDVFCKTSTKGRIPKNASFQPLSAEEDPSASTLISLAIPKESSRSKMSFAGSARVSTGFMQTIIELLSNPGDIVFDWTVGEGCSFLAGDYSGRFVIGLEDRPAFGSLAEEFLKEVYDRKKGEEIAPEVSERAEETTRDLVDLDEDPYAILGENDVRTPSPSKHNSE